MQVYLFECNDYMDQVKVRNWAIQENLVVRSCYDTRNHPNYTFQCQSCDKVYNEFNAIGTASIDECDGRAYSTCNECCTDCTMIYSESGDFYGSGIRMRIVPNALIVGKFEYKGKSRLRGTDLPSYIPPMIDLSEIKQYIVYPESIPNSLRLFHYEDSEDLLSEWYSCIENM